MEIKLSPSILSADFANLARDIKIATDAGAEYVHVDVMDGHFVPNITIGAPVVKSLRKATDKVLDVHLMIVEPWKFIDQFAKLGIHIMNVHYEVCPHLHRTLRAIREAGMRPAVTLNPHTPVELLTDILCEADMVLLMSVNPGYGGQKFIEQSVRKVERLRKMIQEQGLPTLIQVDGGVNLETGRQLIEAGADSLVAGSAVFKAPSPKDMIAQLHAL